MSQERLRVIMPVLAVCLWSIAASVHAQDMLPTEFLAYLKLADEKAVALRALAMTQQEQTNHAIVKLNQAAFNEIAESLPPAIGQRVKFAFDKVWK